MPSATPSHRSCLATSRVSGGGRTPLPPQIIIIIITIKRLPYYAQAQTSNRRITGRSRQSHLRHCHLAPTRNICLTALFLAGLPICQRYRRFLKQPCGSCENKTSKCSSSRLLCIRSAELVYVQVRVAFSSRNTVTSVAVRARGAHIYVCHADTHKPT